MFSLLLILLLLISLPQDPAPADRHPLQSQNATDPSGISIVEFSYETKMVKEDQLDSTRSSNTSTEPNPPPGWVVRRTPEERTPARDLSERMRDLRQLPRSRPRPSVRVRKFLFRAKMKNETSKRITRFVWSYQPAPGPPEISGKEYLCNTRIEPNGLQAVKVISPIPRQRVVSSTNPRQTDQSLTPALQDLAIKYIEFEDGTTWRHPEWNSTVLLTREAIRKLGKGKCATL